MGGLQPQKTYTNEDQRRKDQRGEHEPDKPQGVLSLFNDWASDKTESYRRDVFRRAAQLEVRLENALEEGSASSLKEEWLVCLDTLKSQRAAFKVGHSENAFQDCYKAKQLDIFVKETLKTYKLDLR